MTAAWDTCDDPGVMLVEIRGRLSTRKLRLFAARAVAAILQSSVTDSQRSVLANDPDTQCLSRALTSAHEAAVELERFADGEIAAKRLRRLLGEMNRHSSHWTWDVWIAHRMISEAIENPPRDELLRNAWSRYGIHRPPGLADQLRELFSVPNHPIPFEARWRTRDVSTLGDGIYAERAFDRMPILADALMDAGCEEEAILEHCREAGWHIRGCWVLDLVLDRN